MFLEGFQILNRLVNSIDYFFYVLVHLYRWLLNYSLRVPLSFFFFFLSATYSIYIVVCFYNIYDIECFHNTIFYNIQYVLDEYFLMTFLHWFTILIDAFLLLLNSVVFKVSGSGLYYYTNNTFTNSWYMPHVEMCNYFQT